MTKTVSNKKEKVAVVMLNLGGPDSPNAIRPFLINFFMDKNIIRLPVPFRCLLAVFIANKRTKREAGESYGELGGSSPLLANTQAQAKALQRALKTDKNAQFKTFVCMRYWHPMSPQVVREVRDWGADRIVILPLYPQFSTTTTWSSLQVWNKAMFEAGYERPTSTICCYPHNQGFIKASAENIKIQYKKAQKDGYKNPRILFSAHGLPESVIRDGDPYQWQCESTAKKIADAMKIKDLDWEICYQSRVGPKKWIGPSTEESLEKAAKEDKAVIIYPHAFTQEHVETLVELDIEYKEEAEEMGLHGYYRAQTVGTHSLFIDGLSKLVKQHMNKLKIAAEGGRCICPTDHNQCCMRYSKTMSNKKKAA
ncbi:MAG: ferrochelatase [Pseudomonadota bacterium]